MFGLSFQGVRRRHMLVYGFVAFLMVYFSYHALSGSRGLWAMLKLRNEIYESEIKLDTIRAERLSMEDRIRGLYTKSLDKDLLEEQARVQLGLAHPEELVIYLKPEDYE